MEKCRVKRALVIEATKRPRVTMKEVERSTAQMGEAVEGNQSLDTPQIWALWKTAETIKNPVWRLSKMWERVLWSDVCTTFGRNQTMLLITMRIQSP